MPEAGDENGPVKGAESSQPAKPRGQWFYYGLGLGLQTFLWFLLFLAITVAVLVGGELTEFRYVGF
jgi:hypothetical protein